jgi:hypothetical protein
MDSPEWALHLQLSERLAHGRAGESEKQRSLWKTPYNDGASKRGAYISKQGMNACMSSNHKALHIYFDFLQKKILNKIQQDYGQRKNP